MTAVFLAAVLGVIQAISFPVGIIALLIGHSNLFFVCLITFAASTILRLIVIGLAAYSLDRPAPMKSSTPEKEYQPGESIETHVAGVTFENRQEVIREIKVSDWLRVGREIDNQFDPNAIAVYTKEFRAVGYINKELAAKIAPIFDRYTLPVSSGSAAQVIEITNPGTDRQGLKIKFHLPDSDDLKADLKEYEATWLR